MTRLYIVDQSGIEVGGHYYSYTGCVAEGARRLGLDVVVFANKKFRVEPKAADYDIWPCFTYTWAEAESRAPLEWRDGNIAYEIARALRRYPAATDDHVFLHTIGYRELLMLLDWFTTALLPGDPIPHFHLLLRRDPDILIDNYRQYARYFTSIGGSPYLRGRLHFHADTKLLADAFARLTGVGFAVAPIPFPHEYLLQAGAARPPHRPGDPLTAIYLGDARTEKGYQHLPAALSYLWPDYVSKGQLRFVLQSNFNTPGGEPGILSAAQNLAGYPGTELLTEALQPRAYYQALMDADLVLIPYSAQCYRYRSSGVLVEAMAAGKPVVTTAGSWMATQLTPQNAILFDDPKDLGQAIAKAVDRIGELSAAAQDRARDTLATTTGENLVRHLLAAVPAPPLTATAGTKRHRVLLVMNGDGMVLQNGSSRVAQAQLRYLADAGYGVVGLFLTYRLGQTAAELAAWRTALGDAIGGFAFERVFIGGPGERTLSTHDLQAISAERRPPNWPLRADFDFAASFEFGAPLLRYLRDHPVEAVLLNYVTNFPVLDALGVADVPVICEMHDLQSLQRAIYGNRPIDPDDLDEEFRWLARCAALISLSPRETGMVRQRLPEAVIETTGIVLPEPPAPLRLLAGVIDLAEIVEMAGPTESARRQDILTRLVEAGFVDLLFVSSNHLANVSGLRWFLSEVYEPYLAAHQVTVVVAGTICDIADWPDLPRIFFIGPVKDLAPLYSATRVVILPILDGAGSPVKSFEALAYGRPVVGTTHAFRGAEKDAAGLLVRDSPEAFAGAVLDLLDSDSAREEAAAQSRLLSRRYNDLASYYRDMDRIFRSILADRATAAPAPAGDEGMPVEWSPRLQAVNRLARSFIAGLPLDGWAVARLKHEPGGDLDRLIDAVSHRLLATRDAVILDTVPELATATAQHGERAAADLGFACRLAIEPAAPAQAVARVLVSAELPLDVASLRSQPIAIDGTQLSFHPRAGLEPTAGAVLFHVQCPKPDGARAGLRVIEMTAGERDPGKDAIVLRHSLSIRPETRLFGREVFEGAFALHGDGTAELRPGASGLVRLPRLADGQGTGFVGLLFTTTPRDGSPHPIAFAVNGVPVEPQVIAAGARTLTRLSIDPHLPGDFGELRVEVHNRHPHVALSLTAAFSGLLTGPLEEAAQLATVLATIGQRPAAIPSPRASEMAQSAILPIVRGLPLPPAALARLASVATGDADMLAALVEQVVRRNLPAGGNGDTQARVKTVIGDIEAIVAAYYGIGAGDIAIFSPALPVAAVDNSGREQPHPNIPGSWVRPLPSSPARLQIKLDAALEIAGYPGSVRATGFHPPEGENTPFRWTGPAAASKIILPLALTTPARLDIKLGHTGANTAPEHFAVFCNGNAVAHAFVRNNDGAILTAELPALASAAPWTEIEFTVAHQFSPPLPDLRVLGVVFRTLLVTLLEPQPVAARDRTTSAILGEAEAATLHEFQEPT